MPWGPDGVPDLFIPPLPTSTESGDPNDVHRAGVAVHALADGTPLLRAPDELFARFVDRVRLIRLSSPVTSIDIAADDGQVQDVVMDAEGGVFVLDAGGDGRRFTVRRLRPNGAVAWTTDNLPARFYSRFLADSEGRVFLQCEEGADYSAGSGVRFLLRVDDRSGQVVARREGWTPHLRLDGRVFFTRWDVDHWSLLDDETGVTSAFENTRDNHLIMARLVGVDTDGNLYGRDFGGVYARMTPLGDVDWLVESPGTMPSAAVTPDGEVLVAMFGPAGVQVMGLKARD